MDPHSPFLMCYNEESVFHSKLFASHAASRGLVKDAALLLNCNSICETFFISKSSPFKIVGKQEPRKKAQIKLLAFCPEHLWCSYVRIGLLQRQHVCEHCKSQAA